MAWIWKLYWKLSGWKVKGSFPYQHKKMILLVAPHTSWQDVVVGFAARSILRIDHAKFLGKKELFDGPFGWLFRWLGGVPVDRFSAQGAVQQVADLFNKNKEFMVAMSPEGTRQKVDKLRTGFYYIARQAQVPLLMVGLDFARKELLLSEPFYPGPDESADFRRIISFFAPVKGRHPDKGLAHLQS